MTHLDPTAFGHKQLCARVAARDKASGESGPSTAASWAGPESSSSSSTSASTAGASSGGGSNALPSDLVGDACTSACAISEAHMSCESGVKNVFLKMEKIQSENINTLREKKRPPELQNQTSL